MAKQKLQIHSENILPIIKKWLYSDKDIFVRELVSNSCDALSKLKILRDRGEVQAPDPEFRVDVSIDKEKKLLRFSDTGIGMTAEEVEKYIAQIAFSGAEEFLSKYKGNNEQDQVIGHFGLGFYSAYMIANKVELNTLSYLPGAEAVFWSCDGSSDYEIGPGSRKIRGTEIILHVSSDNEEYLEEARLREILQHYCDFLPYPIYLNDNKINTKEPLWIKAPAECSKEDYLDFYSHLYPHEEPPLFWLHLNVDYPFRLKGILYFPKIHRKFDVNKSSVKLYCNRVFVADNCKDILPNYLMALRGVIDSPDIPLNVSRSYLQVDRTVRQTSQHISKKVADSLSILYRNERERFIANWPDASLVIKLGAIEDEKFYERVKDFLIWKNLSGEWVTVEEYLSRNENTLGRKVFYTQDERPSHFLNAYRQQNIEVLYANSFIDPYLINFLEKKLTPLNFQRIDAAVEEGLLDKSKEKTILDASGKTEATKLAEFIRSKLTNPQVDVEAKSLAVENLPGLVVIEERQRRMREYMLSIDPEQGESLSALGQRKFVVNTNNPLFNAIQTIDKSDPELAQAMVLQLYEMALLSQKELNPVEVHQFLNRTTQVLEKLSSKLTG